MIRYVILAVASVVLAVFGAVGLFLKQRPPVSTPGYLVQKGLYPLDLTYLQGQPARGGSPTLLEFWQINCPGCLESIKHLNQLHAKYAGRGLQIVGVTPDTPEALQKFMRRAPIDYALAHDAGDRYWRALNVYGLPDAVLLDAGGTIRWRGDPRTLTENDIEQVLK